MNDIELLKKLDLENQLKFARERIKTLQEENQFLTKEVQRYRALLNGDDVFMNSIQTKREPT